MFPVSSGPAAFFHERPFRRARRQARAISLLGGVGAWPLAARAHRPRYRSPRQLPACFREQMRPRWPLAKAKQTSAENPAPSKIEIDDQLSANPLRDL